MTVEELIAAVATDKIALVFLFLLLPCMAVVNNKLTSLRGMVSPYIYIYATIVYATCIFGVLSIGLWIHTALFQEKGLLDLNFFVYYLPVFSMIITLAILKKQIVLSHLPWFGEFYELVILLSVAFGLTLFIIDKEWLHFSNAWYIFLFSGLLFGIFKTTWERISQIR